MKLTERQIIIIGAVVAAVQFAIIVGLAVGWRPAPPAPTQADIDAALADRVDP